MLLVSCWFVNFSILIPFSISLETRTVFWLLLSGFIDYSVIIRDLLVQLKVNLGLTIMVTTE